ncbi:hypothetical protein FGU65_01335 [Methanoculleus sp. FWC-SCC1]|uniref:Uncharacterized protein n=1 Tax=Methanoculleus frigidifontis TaxID=2584085 RepID=A0ABT8M6N2_9EURY|nr:hypothetical protein [Methanoculleus sp. FWC-SCC1]MDN7023554.1 hypothetical protein [Methanoculleus sp. FWC-SCC1]
MVDDNGQQMLKTRLKVLPASRPECRAGGGSVLRTGTAAGCSQGAPCIFSAERIAPCSIMTEHRYTFSTHAPKMTTPGFVPVPEEPSEKAIAVQHPDQSFDVLQGERVETEKNQRLTRDMDRIRSRGTFAVFDPWPPHSSSMKHGARPPAGRVRAPSGA